MPDRIATTLASPTAPCALFGFAGHLSGALANNSRQPSVAP